jgi:pimeloyl-ACP methyl ester carboxylesterase
MIELPLPPIRTSRQWPAPGGAWSYDTWGTNGRPVILIPTVLFPRSSWWPVAADLRPHATVIAVDLPGHGSSTRRRGYPAEVIVDDLAEPTCGAYSRTPSLTAIAPWPARSTIPT